MLTLDPDGILHPNAQFKATSDFAISLYNASNTLASPSWKFYAIHANGVPYSNTTTDTVAVQSVELTSHPWSSAEILTTTPGAFFTDLVCDEAEVLDIKNKTFGSRTERNLYEATFRTPTCKTTIESYRFDSTQANKRPPYKENFVPYAEMVSCQGDDESSTNPAFLVYLSLADQQLAIVKTSATICRPTFKLLHPKTTWDISKLGTSEALSVDLQSSSQNTTIPQDTARLLASSILNSTSSVFLSAPDLRDVSEAQGRLFTLMSVLQGRQPDQSVLRPFLDNKVLIDRAKQVFQGVATQYAVDSFTKPVTQMLEGEVVIVEQRLTVNIVSVILMSVGFGMLIALTCGTIFTRAWNVVPGRAESLQDILELLKQSGQLKTVLSSTGHLRAEDLQKHLQGFRFRSTVEPLNDGLTTFRVNAYSDNAVTDARSEENDTSKVEWWRPFIVQLYSKAMIVLVPLILVIVLEVLQRKSDNNNGFIGSDEINTSARYALAYIPAAIFVATALLYTALEDAANIFAPYHALRRPRQLINQNGGVQQEKSSFLSKNFLYTPSQGLPAHTHGQVPLVALFTALKARYWAASFAIVAGFLCPFLTIIVSGLYTVEQVSSTSQISVQQTDQLDLNSWKNSARNDLGAGTITSQILNHGAEYPRWTYQDLVFPSLHLADGQAGQLLTTVPSLRGKLNCTLTRPSEVSFKKYSFGGTVTTTSLNVTVNMVDTCGGKYLPRNVSFSIEPPSNQVPANSSVRLTSPLNSQKRRYYLSVREMHFQALGISLDANFQAPDNPEGCPSLMFYAVSMAVIDKPGPTDWETNLTALVCRQQIEEVQTNVTFQLPAYSVDKANPPKTLEQTARYVDNGTAGAVSRSYQIANWLSVGFEDPTPFPFNGETIAHPFYSAVVKSPNMTSLDKLFGEENVENFIQATNRGYGLYMAQALSGNTRETLGTGDPQSSPSAQALVGQLEKPGPWRIQQNATSKIILQVLLSVMLVCGLIAGLLMDTKELLPHCPCSIAGVASWFADSSLWSARRAGMYDMSQGGQQVETRSAYFIGWHEQGDIQGMGTNIEYKERWFGIDATPDTVGR